MELNIETAVRLCPVNYNNNNLICVQSNTINNTVQLANAQSYPVNYALPSDCCQNTLFTTTVTPLINYLLEGCDISVVTFGQSGTGKSYTLLGPGFHFASSESEHGIIPRFIREVFTKVKQYRDRSFSIHITWSQICGENVQDLLGAGSVECTNITEVFQLIQLGMSNITPKGAHTLFTLTLEQQWVVDGTVQHRISTASFTDLAGSEKVLVYDSNGTMQTVPADSGLLALQRCIMSLSDSYSNQFNFVPYTQSVLTTLLKDSFGGRAKTLFICCVSPLVQDFTETLYSLQLTLRAQMIKNLVTVNSYTTFESPQDNLDIFGLQFAANQLFKLVSNAEELFQKIVSNGTLTKNEQDQIVQWLTLKQECEDCLSENSEPHRSLERIEEEIEGSCESSESEANEEEDSQNFCEKLQEIADKFRDKTDLMIAQTNKSDLKIDSSVKESVTSSNSEYRIKGARGRRASIHSAEELEMSKTNGNFEIVNEIPLKYKYRDKKAIKCVNIKKISEDDCSKALVVAGKLNVQLSDEDLEQLRHEIRNLRKTRDYLLEQRCKIDVKTQHKQLLNEIEERKLLQYEEAIEAIDLAIEYKNEVICGRQPLVDRITEKQDERDDQMLMERLMKLNENEMRILLHKYFEKIIDLRSNSKKLEMHVTDVENQNESLVYRVQNLSHTLRQVRIDSERRIISLQQQHKDKLHLVMRHLANGDATQDNEGVLSRVSERAKQSALTLTQVAGASKQGDKSLIARFTRYARHESGPRQVQAASHVPQAKVTRQKNKIFIQQTNK